MDAIPRRQRDSARDQDLWRRAATVPAQKGWKAPDLAKALKRDASTVTRWANGTSVPNLLMIEPLANALGVEPRYLYHPEPIPTDYPLSLVRQVTPAAVEEGARRARSRRDGAAQ